MRKAMRLRTKKVRNVVTSGGAILALVCHLYGAEESERWPANLKAESIPAIPATLRREVNPYLEFRSAAFQGWHPKRHEMIITTRFADTMQLHSVAFPAAARRQLTFLAEPVAHAEYSPSNEDAVLYAQDSGGGEAFQLYLFQPSTGKSTLLTDGKSRHTSARWSPDGKRVAFNSTARNGADNDIWILDPSAPAQRSKVCDVTGGGWSVADWSPDQTRLLVSEFRSANESHLWLLTIASGKLERLSPEEPKMISRDHAIFSRDGKSIYFSSDEGGEFQTLGTMTLAERTFRPLTSDIAWSVEGLALSHDGQTIALTTNEAGASVLRFLRVDGQPAPAPPVLPLGVIGGLAWSSDDTEIGFTLTSARSSADAWSFRTGSQKLTRWTTSETGGLIPESFREPTLIRRKSFDGTEVSGFLYLPDPARHQGRRPIIVSIHGGPEGQSRPVFQGRNNYYLNELGIALLFPNVRGSDGYGKTFLAKDNGFLREDSVRDIGAFLDAIAEHPQLDAARIGVTGGSYGGYMTLASLIHHGERLRAGCAIVGISNFLTFLANTSDYRRDLRRVEYGDEREPQMHAHLASISPLTRAKDLQRPLMVVQGKNDPRVPASEADQIVAAVRQSGTPVWYLLADDEGHGFAKKKNVDLQFLATICFWRDFLLNPPSSSPPK
jgi:dipeptidyl aminopeptidase/acylaminoacyl peptidase